MRVIDTFICHIPDRNLFVKVYRGRNSNADYMYFMEIDNSIVEIDELYFNKIKEVE